MDLTIAVLKNWKSPGSDGVSTELIKHGGKKLHQLIFKLFIMGRRTISNNEAIIILLQKKKKDKKEHENYRGVSKLNTTYKTVPRTILKHLIPCVEKYMGEYQCEGRENQRWSSYRLLVRKSRRNMYIVKYVVTVHKFQEII